MCDPTAVFIMQAASTAVNMSAQNRAANDAAQAQQKQHQLEQQRRALKQTSDMIQDYQQGIADADKAEQIVLEREKKAGAVKAAAASSGAIGGSLAVLQDIEREELQNLQLLNLQSDMRKQSSFLRQQSDELASKATHESIGSESIYGANLLSGALDIGQSYAQMKIDQA